MPEPVFSRILLKLSGEVLSNKYGFGIDPEKVLYLAREIKPVYESNVNIGLIKFQIKERGPVIVLNAVK